MVFPFLFQRLKELPLLKCAPSCHRVTPAHHKHLRLSAAKRLHCDIKHLSFGLRWQSQNKG